MPGKFSKVIKKRAACRQSSFQRPARATLSMPLGNESLQVV